MSKGDRTVNINFRGGSGNGGQKSSYPSNSRSHGSSHDGRAKSSPHAEQPTTVVLKVPDISPVGLVSPPNGDSGAAQAQQLVVQALEAQGVKEANEAYAAQQAKIQQERDAAGIAHKLQLAKDFEATRLGIVTRKLQQAEEIYAAKVEQYKNVPRNFNYHEDRVIAARQVDQAAKQVKDFQATKYLIEQEVDQDRRQAARQEEFRIQQAKEKQDIIDAQQARINPSKKEAEKIKLTLAKHNTNEVEIYSPKIKTILKQYKSDYEGFNRQVISDAIPIQLLHTLSLKKTNSVDSHVVDLVFDLLRDNHLPSLKTLDLSDNPKSIGAVQINKLTDSFLSRNNNLETLDISCVYPSPKGRGWYSWEQRGEHLGYDSYANLVTRDKLSSAFNKLLLSVSTCVQPLCITIDTTTSQGGFTLDPKNSLILPANFLSRVNYRGSDISFKTTGSVMLEHMIRLCQNKNHDAEDFTWGITKCLTARSEIDSLSAADIEYIKGISHFPSRSVISLTKELHVFLGVTEALENSIISHDMLKHEGTFTALFGRDNWWGIGSRGLRPEEPREKGVSKGGTTTIPFVSSCKNCEERQLKEIGDSIRSDTLESEELFAALFGRDNWSRMGERGQEQEEKKDGGREERPEEFSVIPFTSARRYEVGSIKMNPYLLQVDVTTIINLDLSHSNMDDVGANIVSNLLKRGSLPNLKYLDVSDNQITATGDGFFAKVLQSPLVQDIIITIKKYSTDLGQQVIKPALKEFIEYAGRHGVDITNLVTNKGAVEYLKDGGKIVGNLILGYGKCTYKVIEVLTLDITVPGLTVDYLVEKSGKAVLKQANFQLCIAMETYDAFVSPEGVDLVVQVVELLGE